MQAVLLSGTRICTLWQDSERGALLAAHSALFGHLIVTISTPKAGKEKVNYRWHNPMTKVSRAEKGLG